MGFVRIQTPIKPDECLSVTGVGTEITTVDGQPIYGVQRISLVIDPREAIKAEICLLLNRVSVPHADAVFYIEHPITGKIRCVRSIEFMDGETFSFEELKGEKNG